MVDREGKSNKTKHELQHGLGTIIDFISNNIPYRIIFFIKKKQALLNLKNPTVLGPPWFFLLVVGTRLVTIPVQTDRAA